MNAQLRIVLSLKFHIRLIDNQQLSINTIIILPNILIYHKQLRKSFSINHL